VFGRGDLQLAERGLEVLADVVGERFERRDVDDEDLVGKRPVQPWICGSVGSP
jgi:hypothetical protein